MNEEYNQAIDRLWERLEYHKDLIDKESVDDNATYSELLDTHPFLYDIVQVVEDELDCELNDNQLNMAIWCFLHRDMEGYSEMLDLNLHPRGPEVIEPERGFEEVKISIGEKKLMVVYSEEGENSYKKQMIQGPYLLDLLVNKFGDKLDKAGELVKEVIDELSEMDKDGELTPYRKKYYDNEEGNS